MRFPRLANPFLLFSLTSLFFMESFGQCPVRMRPGRDALQPAAGDSLKGLPVRRLFTEQEIRSEMGSWAAQGVISFLIGLSYGSISSCALAAAITRSPVAAGAGFFLGGLYLAARNLAKTEEMLYREALERMEAKRE